MIIIETTTIFVLGGLAYGLLEIIWRGHTHWSMLVTGGLCSMLLYVISNRGKERLWQKCIMGSAVITTVEFIAGIIINIKLGWKVWDYSKMSFNLFGQICPQYSLLWTALSAPALLVCRKMKKRLFSHQ